MTFAQLSPRERVAVAIAAVAVLAALFYAGLVAPYRGALRRLDARIATRQRQLGEIAALQQRYQQLQRRVGEAEQRLAKAEAFSLFAYVEGLAGQMISRENLVSMRPQPATVREDLREETVEVRLEKVRLDQLVRLLHAIDSNEALLAVKSLKIKTRFDNRAQLDAVLTIASYRRSA
jgi:general secretion pathway protein M